MNDDLYKRARDKAKELRERFKPALDTARDATERQAENAVVQVSRLLKRAAKAVRDDIEHRP